MNQDQAQIEAGKIFLRRHDVIAEALQTEVSVDPCSRCHFTDDGAGPCPGNFQADCPQRGSAP